MSLNRRLTALLCILCAILPAIAENQPSGATHANHAQSQIIRQAELLPSDGQPLSFFGNSVAVSGDTVVVGSPGYVDDNGNAVPGYAYVFVKPAGGWTSMIQTAELKAEDFGNSAGNDFGYSVAIANDTIVVGCAGLSQAYVYVKPAGGWTNMTETAILSTAPSQYSPGFGFSVAIDSSAQTIVVGAVYAQGAGGLQ